MTILCAGDCHVWLGSSSICVCGAEQTVLIPFRDRVAMYGLILPYNPFGPHAPQPTPLPDVPLHVFKAAQDVHATHLSADGLTAYDERQLGVWYAGWDEEEKSFGSWYKILCGILPNDAVRM